MKNLEENRVIQKISDIGGRIGSNIYISSISQGIMGMFPIIIIGAFASLFVGLSFDGYQIFIHQTGLYNALSMVVNATTNCLGLWFTFGIAQSLNNRMAKGEKIVPILALVTYIALLPFTVNKMGGVVFGHEYLGTKGMIVGIFIAIFIVKLYKFVEGRNWMIKMPVGTPEYVSNSFSALIPGFIVVIAGIMIRILIGLTPYRDIFTLLYSLLQIPLTKLVGGNLFANLFFIILTQVFWAVGVHPGFLSSMLGPILFSLDGMNQAAFAAHQEVPNIIGFAFSYITTIATFYPAISFAILLFAKSNRLRSVSKIAVFPSIFGISEPLVFGIPIMFNPLLWLPWIIAPTFNFAFAYFVTQIGLVSKAIGVMVVNMPLVVTGMLNGHVSIAIMEIVLCVIDILIFAPFIMILDKNYRKDELNINTNN